MNKPELRRLMSEALESISDGLLRSVQLWCDLAETPEYQQATMVMAYASMRTEVDTAGLFARLRQDGKTLLLPRIEPERIVAVKDADGWTTGGYGIKEPLGPSIDPQLIDLVIVPGLAFTLDGKRLGRGRGYYDAFLLEVRAPTIGVCFSEQILEDLPMEPHDTKLDRVMVA